MYDNGHKGEDDDPMTFIAFPRIVCPHWPQIFAIVVVFGGDDDDGHDYELISM